MKDYGRYSKPEVHKCFLMYILKRGVMMFQHSEVNAKIEAAKERLANIRIDLYQRSGSFEIKGDYCKKGWNQIPSYYHSDSSSAHVSDIQQFLDDLRLMLRSWKIEIYYAQGNEVPSVIFSKPYPYDHTADLSKLEKMLSDLNMEVNQEPLKKVCEM